MTYSKVNVPKYVYYFVTSILKQCFVIVLQKMKPHVAHQQLLFEKSVWFGAFLLLYTVVVFFGRVFKKLRI